MLTEKQIEVAVEWWAGKIMSPVHDNGDPGTSILAMALIDPTPPEDTEEFKRVFSEILRNHNPRVLPVDYHAEGVLALVEEKTGVTNWPWKTTMFFRDGGVTVRAGYGAPGETLLEANSAEQGNE